MTYRVDNLSWLVGFIYLRLRLADARWCLRSLQALRPTDPDIALLVSRIQDLELRLYNHTH